MTLTKRTAQNSLASDKNIRVFVDGENRVSRGVVIIDDDGNHVPIDPIHKSMELVQPLHHETHKGNAYEVSRIFEDVASDGNADVLIKVGANKDLHLVAHVSGGGDIYARIYEATTVSADGTGIITCNKNRNFSDGSDGLFYYSPTVTGVGTLLLETYIPGGSGGIAVGGSADIDYEQDLKKDTNYLIRVVNKAGLAKTISIWLVYYEV